MDDQGNPLFNQCNTHGYFYEKIVSMILDRAQQVFDVEVMSSVKKRRQFHSPW
jgi:hypothetical protein